MTVYVARHANGIFLNSEPEYLLDSSGNPIEFVDRKAAATYLLNSGLTTDDLQFLFAPEVGVEYPWIGDMPSLIPE